MEEVGCEGKLGNHLVPLHYSLHLNPCLTTFTFAGKVTIDLELRKPTDRILVNAKQLKVEEVTLTKDEVEVEEEEKEKSTSKPSPNDESPASGEEDEGGRDGQYDDNVEENNDRDVEEEDTSAKENTEKADKTKTSSRFKVSRLQKEWDDDEDEDSNAEEDCGEKDASEEESVKSEENGEDSNNSNDGGAFQITSDGNGDVVNCSDDSSDSVTTGGAVKRKSANDSTDGWSDVKYKKADDDSDEEQNHWSSRAPLKWSRRKDDEVYAVSDDDEEDVTQVDCAGEPGESFQERISDEDIFQVDGADSFEEDGEEPWNLVKTSRKAVEISSFEVLEAEEVLEINLSNILQPCHLSLTVTYSGTLDDSMRGFYRTRHPEGWGAACHFEATGARKCFPCIDQPEFRTTFDISVRRPSPCLTVLSNMPAIKEDDSEGVVTFARTPEIPTYLICIIIGHYSSLSHRTQGGVPVSVFTPCERTRQGEYALNIAVKAVEFFTEFFGLPYTLPKIDLVAVPDFYIGAMENWGLLTFRETALLFEPDQGSERSREYVAILVTHEVAHQWFGNLVSLAWWDQLWLKEGFATWASFLATDHICPHLNIWEQFLTIERLSALHLDSLDSSHPIEIPDGVQHPGQIDEIFDDISYSKGASIINMLYHWIGAEGFQAGLQLYLSRHKFGSATTCDLWSAVGEASGQPVEQVMTPWTREQGFPRISVVQTGAGLEVTQSGVNETCRGKVWSVPLRLEVRSSKGEVREERQLLIEEAETRLSLQMRPGSCLVVNAGQTSFCRVTYTSSQAEELGKGLAHLPVRDRLGVISDLADAWLGGIGELSSLVNMLRCYAGEVDWPVLQIILDVLGKLEELTEASPAWAGYLSMAYSVLRPSLAALDWEATEGESGGTVLARAAVVQRLARLGCVETIGKCWVLWQREREDRASVQADLRRGVYSAIAKAGGDAEMRQLISLYEKVENAEQRRPLFTALAQSSQKRQVLDWAISEQVRPQDKVFIIAGIAASGAEGRSLAWSFFKEKSDYLLEQYTSGQLLKMLVTGVTRYGTSEEEADIFSAWFKDRGLVGVERSLSQAEEEVRVRANNRRRLANVAADIFPQ